MKENIFYFLEYECYEKLIKSRNYFHMFVDTYYYLLYIKLLSLIFKDKELIINLSENEAVDLMLIFNEIIDIKENITFYYPLNKVITYKEFIELQQNVELNSNEYVKIMKQDIQYLGDYLTLLSFSSIKQIYSAYIKKFNKPKEMFLKNSVFYGKINVSFDDFDLMLNYNVFSTFIRMYFRINSRNYPSKSKINSLYMKNTLLLFSGKKSIFCFFPTYNMLIDNFHRFNYTKIKMASMYYFICNSMFLLINESKSLELLTNSSLFNYFINNYIDIDIEESNNFIKMTKEIDLTNINDIHGLFELDYTYGCFDKIHCKKLVNNFKAKLKQQTEELRNQHE